MAPSRLPLGTREEWDHEEKTSPDDRTVARGRGPGRARRPDGPAAGGAVGPRPAPGADRRRAFCPAGRGLARHIRYYRWRARISQRLIREKGFSFIAVEGDWPDCYRVNRYVKGLPDSGADAREVLHAFDRWPTWMWANEEVVELAEWLRGYNDGQAEDRKVGFFGLDVYSLWESLYAVLGYLRKADPSALPAARRAFRCFQPFGEDVQAYARATAMVPTSCEDEVIDLLEELRRREPRYRDDGSEEYFAAEQNALVVKGAEAYYRAMVRGGPESWNIRDRHMTETLERLMRHHGPDARAIVWEHNTHIGDARATDMADDGMVNVGQLVRERHAGEGVVLVGFGSYRGSVIAGDEWEAPMESMRVPPGREGSWEDILHRAGAATNCSCSTASATTRTSSRSAGIARSAWCTTPIASDTAIMCRPSSPAATTPSAISTRLAPFTHCTSARTWRRCPRRIPRACRGRCGEWRAGPSSSRGDPDQRCRRSTATAHRLDGLAGESRLGLVEISASQAGEPSIGPGEGRQVVPDRVVGRVPFDQEPLLARHDVPGEGGVGEPEAGAGPSSSTTETIRQALSHHAPSARESTATTRPGSMGTSGKHSSTRPGGTAPSPAAPTAPRRRPAPPGPAGPARGSPGSREAARRPGAGHRVRRGKPGLPHEELAD